MLFESISGTFQMAYLDCSLVSQEGPFHQSLQSFSAAPDNPLVGGSAVFSFVLIYLNTISFDSIISLILLLTNTEVIFAPLIHDNTHIESDHKYHWMLGI